MPVFDLYAKRKKRAERGNAPEVFQYEDLPRTLRTQIRQILTGAIGRYVQMGPYDMHTPDNNNDAWEELAKILRREMGVDNLAGRGVDPYSEIMHYIDTAATDDVLGVVELCCRYVDKIASKFPDYKRQQSAISQEAAGALDELNVRFREAGVGYEYQSGEIMRVDSQFIHAEVVKAALSVLRDTRFKGAEDEFLEAHSHFRIGKNKDAVTGANRAFESTMKAICDIKGWPYDPKARGSDLIKVLRANKLFPDYLDGSFDQLVATLASGLPQVRNNAGGHGQGAAPRATPDFVAAYALHLAATNIVFLAEAALNCDEVSAQPSP